MGVKGPAIIARTSLVAVTMLCLLSMGGAMLFAFPFLVPMHWLAARDSGPYAFGAWSFLAAVSMFEAGWMSFYVVSENEFLSVLAGAVVALGTAAIFLHRGAARAVARSIAT